MTKTDRILMIIVLVLLALTSIGHTRAIWKLGDRVADIEDVLRLEGWEWHDKLEGGRWVE